MKKETVCPVCRFPIHFKDAIDDYVSCNNCGSFIHINNFLGVDMP